VDKITKGVGRYSRLVGSLIFYALSELYRATLRIAGYKPSATAVAIYYHHVISQERPAFQRQLDHLLRWTAPIGPLDRSPLKADARYTFLTADDGWKSFLDNAIPLLVERKIPITIFLVSDRLGLSIDDIDSDRIVTETEIHALDHNEEVMFGSHTATHARMTSITEDAAVSEFVRSREQLSSIIGAPVKMFCFPYGSFNPELAQLALKAGYDRVFTTEPHMMNPSDIVVGRVRVDPSDSLLEFHLKIMGAYRWTVAAIRLKRWTLARLNCSARPASPVPQSNPATTADSFNPIAK
jgi:peptidoglycan/xylan/chitin deacetylase (PgdA/CDA1 family)